MRSPEAKILLSNAAADSAATKVVGGTYIWAASATWSGGSLKLQALGPDASTYIDIAGASLSANGFIEVDLAAGSTVKAVITGSPIAIYSSLVSVPGE